MSAKPHPLLTLLSYVQDDLRAVQAKLIEIRAQVALLDLDEPERHTCSCGLSFKSALKLAEHGYTAHDGPEPTHWRDAEDLAA